VYVAGVGENASFGETWRLFQSRDKTELNYRRCCWHVFLSTFLLLFAFAASLESSFAQTTTDYTYDALGRLIQSSDSLNTTHQYVYDAAGNRTSETAATASSPGFRVNSVSGTENQVLNFQITRTTSLGSMQTIDYTTSQSGSAVATADFVPTSGTLTFSPADTSKTVSVSAVDDALYEGNETFTLVLSNASGGAAISVSSGTGTIIDDDPLPVIAINDASAPEGSSLVFTLTKIGQTVLPSSVTVQAGGGSATANQDYAPYSTSVSFAAGETSKPISMPLMLDTVYEGAETVNLTVGSPVQATIGRSPGLGTLLETTGAPVFSIIPSTPGPGYKVNLSGSTAIAHAVTLTVTGGTATAGADYTTIGSQTLNFPAGTSSIVMPVSVIADPLLFEGPETVIATLSGASNGATINSLLSAAVATIVEDAVSPSVKISTTGTVTEGGTVSLTVTKVIGGAYTVAVPISVNYATASGSAISGSDFAAQSGTLTFAPSQLALPLTITTIDDAIVEQAEVFSVILTDPTVGVGLHPESTAVVNINDNEVVNSAPILVKDTFSVPRCTTSDLLVLNNDTDPDGAIDLPLEVVSVTGNINFDVVFDPLSGKNKLTFTAPNVLVNQTATYTAKDKRGAQSSASVTVIVTAATCV
jgi:YD repeat-containing protein